MLFKKNTKAIGDSAEELACNFLKKNKIKILERNFRVHTGEIDIIAREKDTIIFIEVKFRKNSNFGHPFESVTPTKQQKIIQTAQFFLQKHQTLSNYNCRFDVISIENSDINWIKNAFDATN